MPFMSPRLPGEVVFEGLDLLDKPLVLAVNHDKSRERTGLTTAVLMQCFGYKHLKSGREIWVPSRYVTDFASIPALARGLIPSYGRHAIAAVLHDWLYSIGEPGQREAADTVFNDALKDLEVDDIKRGIMHRSVRIGGAGGYNRAAQDWPRKTFMDWITGEWLDAPWPREAFFGQGDPAVLQQVRSRPPENCGA